MVLLLKLRENIYMNHKELVDKVSANLIREQGKFESLKSWVSMRNYLQQLSDEQLKAILKDIP